MRVVKPHTLWTDESAKEAMTEISKLTLTTDDVLIVKCLREDRGQALAYDLATLLQRHVILIIDDTELMSVNWKDLMEVAS